MCVGDETGRAREQIKQSKSNAETVFYIYENLKLTWQRSQPARSGDHASTEIVRPYITNIFWLIRKLNWQTMGVHETKDKSSVSSTSSVQPRT